MTTQNTADNEPGEALKCCLCSKPLTTLPNETAYCRNLKSNPSSFDDWKANSCPMARQSTCLPIVVWKALNASRAPLAAVADGISWTALLTVLERLRSKNKNPEADWYNGWNAAIQCLINDINSRAAASSPAPAEPPKFVSEVDQWKHDLTTAGRNAAAPAQPLWADKQWTSIDNWPLPDVLSRLADAAEHLLRDHDCDQHGHETLMYASQAARQHVALLTAPAEPLQLEGQQEKGIK